MQDSASSNFRALPKSKFKAHSQQDGVEWLIQGGVINPGLSTTNSTEILITVETCCFSYLYLVFYRPYSLYLELFL